MIGTAPVRSDLLSALPVTVADAFSTLLPQLRTCKAKYGRLDLEELKQMGVAAPAVLVSRLSLRQTQPADSCLFFDAEMAAFVATKNALGLDRMTAAQAISQALAARVADARWGLPECGPAHSLNEQVLETDASRSAQLGLIAVTWLQPVALTRPDLEDCAIPPELYVGHAPKIGAAHEDAYRLIGGET